MEQLDAFGTASAAVQVPTRVRAELLGLCEASQALVAESRALLDRLAAEERQAVLNFDRDAQSDKDGGRLMAGSMVGRI